MSKLKSLPGTSGSGGEIVKILVVDDDKHILGLVSEFLADGGYDVSTAASGEEAITLFQKGAADIVIVDLKMQGIDGISTIRRLTEISPCTVAILMTGFPTIESSITALRLGASDYILKPFKLDEISSAVRRAEGEWRMRTELKRLKDRLRDLEESISGKKSQIKTNWKLDTADGSRGASSTFINSSESKNT